MRFVLAMVLAGLVALPLSASAQADEEGTAAEPNLVEEPAPSSEPAPEEPALQLRLDAAGIEVVPSPPRTFDGYTVEELELRKRRAAFGLIAPAALIVAGVPPLVLGTSGDRCTQGLEFDSDHCRRLRTAGLVLTISGAVGMIVALPLAGGRARVLRWAERDYALEELKLSVKRAKIGLGVSGGVLVASFVMMGAAVANWDSDWVYPDTTPDWVGPVGWTGLALMAGGSIGMIVAGAFLARSKRQLRRPQQAHYERPRRVQWDLAGSRLVF
jgi:hypothetical protein